MSEGQGTDGPSTLAEESTSQPQQKRSRINEDELDVQSLRAQQLISSPAEHILRSASSPLPVDEDSAFTSLSEVNNAIDPSEAPAVPQSHVAQPQLQHIQQLQFAQMQQLQQLQALWLANPYAAALQLQLCASQQAAAPSVLNPFAALPLSPFTVGASSALANGSFLRGEIGSSPPLPFAVPTIVAPAAASFVSSTPLAPKPQHKKALDQPPPDEHHTYHKVGGAKVGTRCPVLRQVWRCAKQPCSAQWVAEVSFKSDAATVNWNRSGASEHTNHGPNPPRVRIAEVTRNRAKELLTVGNAKPAQLHQQLVLEAVARANGGEIGEGEVPTRRQLETLKYRTGIEGMPHGRDRVLNVAALFHAELRLSNISPPRYVYMADWQLNVAAEPHYLFVDTTFDLVENKLKLSTLLALPLTVEMLVPIAWCIHSGMDSVEYGHLFRAVTDAVTSRSLQMRSCAVFTDFDIALRNALQAVWPSVPHYGDLFHFLQAIRRWCMQHGQDANVALAVAKARELATTRPDAAFRAKLTEFLSFWKVKSPPFSDYFEQQWTKRTQSGQWALSARPEALPTGDQALEGYNNRLATVVFKDRLNVPLDKAMQFLHEEATYTCTLMKNKALSVPHLREREQIRQRADASRPLPRSTSLLPFAPPAAAEAEVDVPTPTDDDDAALSSILPDADNQLPSPPVELAPAVSAAKKIPGLCVTCSRSKNAVCRNNRCQACCVKGGLPCSITTHNKGKLIGSMALELIKEVLCEDEATRQRIYIKYDGGSMPGTVRSVLPLRWIKEPTSLLVLCYKDEANPIEKAYFVARMQKVSRECFLE